MHGVSVGNGSRAGGNSVALALLGLLVGTGRLLAETAVPLVDGVLAEPGVT